jgi:tetratricopeptide (TPR) repeat protein
MIKNQKYILITIIGVLVLSGAVFLVARQGFENGTSSKEQLSVEAPLEDGKVPVDSKTSAGVTEEKDTVTFNTVMTSARTAFLKKEYTKAISLYNEALTYKKHAGAYAGLTGVYSAQQDWTNALVSIDSAITIFPSNTDYWVWKITILNEQKHASFSELTSVYQDGLTKVSSDTKVNLVTSFARVAESQDKKTEAIGLWEYAQRLYPLSKAVYQSEIDRLQNK